MTANVQEISIFFHYASTLATSKALEYLQTNGDGKSGVHPYSASIALLESFP
jgi:hypothetical protein